MPGHGWSCWRGRICFPQTQPGSSHLVSPRPPGQDGLCLPSLPTEAPRCCGRLRHAGVWYQSPGREHRLGIPSSPTRAPKRNRVPCSPLGVPRAGLLQVAEQGWDSRTSPTGPCNCCRCWQFQVQKLGESAKSSSCLTLPALLSSLIPHHDLAPYFCNIRL